MFREKNTDENKQYMQFIIFFGILLTLIAGVWSFEIQPWDEALYALRALSIFDTGNLIDQTDGSLGGLYSSTSPPLTIWAIFASMKLFGVNEFSVRLFSLLCSFASTVIIYYITVNFVDKKWALLSPILLNSALIWNNFSRQAMTEIPLITFSLLCFLMVCKLYTNNYYRKNVLYAGVFALSFAAGLLTKITISLFPLLFVLIFLLSKELKEKKRLLLVASLVGILLTLPYYLYMINTHGEVYYRALLLPHISEAVEGNSRQSGVFYYINLLLISSPLVVYFFFIFKVFRIKLKDSGRQFSENFFFFANIIAFIAFFLAFSFSITKNPHYLCYMIPFAVMLVVYIISKLSQVQMSRLSVFTLLSLLITALFWSSLYTFRQDFKAFSIFAMPINIYNLVLIIAIIGVLLFSIKNLHTKLGKMLSSYQFIMFISILLLCRVIYSNLMIDPQIGFSTSSTINYMKYKNISNYTILYEKKNEGDSLMPQLAWYSKINKVKQASRKIDFSDKNTQLEREIKEIDNEYIILYTPEGLPNIKPEILETLKKRILMKHFNNYLIFSKVLI